MIKVFAYSFGNTLIPHKREVCIKVIKVLAYAGDAQIPQNSEVHIKTMKIVA